jgi:hypothetical protein
MPSPAIPPRGVAAQVDIKHKIRKRFIILQQLQARCSRRFQRGFHSVNLLHRRTGAVQAVHVPLVLTRRRPLDISWQQFVAAQVEFESKSVK